MTLCFLYQTVSSVRCNICAGCRSQVIVQKMMRGRVATTTSSFFLCVQHIWFRSAFLIGRNRLSTDCEKSTASKQAQDWDYQLNVTALKQTVIALKCMLFFFFFLNTLTTWCGSWKKETKATLKQGKSFPVSIRCGNSNRNHDIMCTIESNEKELLVYFCSRD